MNATKRLIKLRDGILTGEHFPKHLQVAYGRGIFRLMHWPAEKAKKRPCLWLRDLPLNLWYLHSQGFTTCLEAYELECKRTGVQPRT